MRPEDVSLSQAILDAHVGDLYSIATDPEEDVVAQWSRLIVLLRTAGYEIVKSGTSSDPPADVYKRVEPKVLALLARCSPKGTKVTPAIIEEARAGIVGILFDELCATGLNERSATMIAQLMGSAVGVRKAGP